uniref:SFRICE_015645 n=1 Tax=Spodoptera frugiperda TaxID=7108 RepID=A0A2H1V528_SPOFR
MCGSSHSVKFCKNTLRCKVCKRRNNFLIHPLEIDVGKSRTAALEGTLSVNEVGGSVPADNKPLGSCLLTGDKQTVLLTTALLKAESRHGKYQAVRALLNQGSQGSFISEFFIPLKNVVYGLGGDKGATSTDKVYVVVRIDPNINPNLKLRVTGYVLKSVTALIPAVRVTRVQGLDVRDSELADPEYFRPNNIDMLLGAEVYSQVIRHGLKKNVSRTLLAQNTALGWILSGTVDGPKPYIQKVLFARNVVTCNRYLYIMCFKKQFIIFCYWFLPDCARRRVMFFEIKIKRSENIQFENKFPCLTTLADVEY